jgi:threonine synthase
MDILKSSNVERIMYDKFGPERTKELMDSLANEGKYQLTEDEIAAIQEDFAASFSDDDECESVVGAYAKKGYIMDPHTATCMKAYERLREKPLKTVVYSTAEWTKFSPAVSKALGKEVEGDIAALKTVSESANVTVPDMIRALFDKPIRHTVVVDKENIKGEMLSFL